MPEKNKTQQNKSNENWRMEKKSKEESKEGPSLGIGILGCFGGLIIQLVIGSLYQWGIVNIYVTSFYRMSDSSLNLQSTGIVFPLMMICIGLTMRLGLYLSQKFHPVVVMGIGQVIQALCIFIASYMQTFWMFILFYGILFGLAAGNSFMVPIDECNRYMVGKRMIVNGIVLMGTGLGSVLFGQFSYNYLNSQNIPPINGYYLGSLQLQEIAIKVPVLVKWLSLLYLVIGLLGVAMLTPVCLYNRRVKNQKRQNDQQKQMEKQEKIFKPLEVTELRNKHEQQPGHLDQTHHGSEHHHDQSHHEDDHHEQTKLGVNILAYTPQKNQQIEPQKQSKQAESIKQAFKSKVFWLSLLVLFFGASGCFMISGNYKTYVKQTIKDDQFLTLIGVIGAVGNGCSRFFWNLLFSKTGYKTVILSLLTLAIIVFSTIRFTIQIKGAYLVEIFLVNICLGGFLVTTPTVLQYIYGQTTGANIYGFFWENFALANMLGYIYVSQVSKQIGFTNIIYVTLAMCVVAFPTVILTKFQGHWKNDTHQLEFFVNVELEKTKSLNKISANVHSEQHLENIEKNQHVKINPFHQNQHENDEHSLYSMNPSQVNQIKVNPNKQ